MYHTTAKRTINIGKNFFRETQIKFEVKRCRST